MKLKLSLACLLAATTIQPIFAQDVDAMKAVKATGSHNPINPIMFCADPTAVEYDGRLYVYGSNDHQEYEDNGCTGNNTYGKITSLVMMSTADMVNWTHHGTIDMKSVCGSWMWNSWAPSIVSRVEDDGLTHFYMYFSNGGGGVGVVTSTSPVGPWEAPISRNLVSGSTAGLGPCSWPFDPGVVIDADGVGWLTLGGGDPVAGATALLPGNAHIVRLGDDMVSLGSDFAHIDAPFEFEASELNIIGGKYVYTYCSSWSDRSMWSQYGAAGDAPSACSMCYMVSDDPLDTNSWTWGGEYLKNPGAFGYPWGNNHTHLHKFNDKYYLFYHTQVMENLAGIGGGYRSIGVDEVEVDESTQTIKPVSATDAGVSQLDGKHPYAYDRQQAETFYNAVGLSISNTATPGNTVVSNIEPGAWTSVFKVDFGDQSPATFTAKIRGTGRLSVYSGRSKGTPLCVVDFDTKKLKDVTVDVTKEITGVHTIYFVFHQADSKTRFDEWQFGDAESGGIALPSAERKLVSEEFFNLSGMKVSANTPGVCICLSKYSDGTTSISKRIR